MSDFSSSHTLAGVLTRLRGGERGAPELEQRLNDAFAKHEGRLKAYCKKELRGLPESQVEEVVQEVLLEAWNKLPTYRREARFRAFLWAIAAWKCANARRKHRDVLSEDGFLEVSSTDRSVFAQLADHQRDELVEHAARAVLNPDEQEVVHLRWVLDYPLADVATLLGLADANTVRVALQRCKRRLEKEILRRLAERGLSASFLGPASDG